MISGRCFFIGILVVVSNNDALLGSNNPPQPSSKEKIVISAGLYRRDALLMPIDKIEDSTCMENAYFFVGFMNTTLNRYDRLYYLNQKRDKDKLDRSFNNYTCPMAINVGNALYDHEYNVDTEYCFLIILAHIIVLIIIMGMTWLMVITW